MSSQVVERGNLEWDGGFKMVVEVEGSEGQKILIPNKVVWRENPNGRWEKVKGWMPREENKIYEQNGQFFPNNNFNHRIGCDPFKYDKTKDKRRSNCASFVYQMKNPLFPDDKYSNMFTMKYAFRPESTRLANEDILLMAWWCGCQVLFERNVNHWKRDFEDWKVPGFLTWLPGEVEPGVYTRGNATTSLVQTICNYTEAYINEHIKKVYFKSLIRKETGWLGFKVEETEQFDEPMAAGITLVAVHGKKYMNSEQESFTIQDYWPKRSVG
jgi:hypothetical protein